MERYTARCPQSPPHNPLHHGRDSAQTSTKTTRQHTETQTINQPAQQTKPSTYYVNSPTTPEPDSFTKTCRNRKPRMTLTESMNYDTHRYTTNGPTTLTPPKGRSYLPTYTETLADTV